MEHTHTDTRKQSTYSVQYLGTKKRRKGTYFSHVKRKVKIRRERGEEGRRKEEKGGGGNGMEWRREGRGAINEPIVGQPASWRRRGTTMSSG